MVSVIMVTYGHEQYIEDSINGVYIQQTDFPVELIIANDCSPDRTDEVIKELLNKAPKNITVRYTRHSKNLGANANFMWATTQVMGKYIALCEGDDYWTDPLKLQKQVDFLNRNEDCSLIFSNAEVIVTGSASESNKNRGMIEIRRSRYYALQETIDDWLIPTASVLFRSNVLDKELNKLLSNEKFIFGDIVLYQFVGRKGKLYGSKEFMVAYRRHLGGATHFTLDIAFYERHLVHLREMNRVFGHQINMKRHSYTMADYSLSLGLYNLNINNYAAGFRYLFLSIKYKPFVFLKYIQNRFVPRKNT